MQEQPSIPHSPFRLLIFLIVLGCGQAEDKNWVLIQRRIEQLVRAVGLVQKVSRAMDASVPSEGVPPASVDQGQDTESGKKKKKQGKGAKGADETSVAKEQGGAVKAGGHSAPVSQPPPRLAALFETALAEGVLQDFEAAGMLKGLVKRLNSGKQTEDAIVAQTTERLASMKQKAEVKRQQAEKKAANKKAQAEAKRQREAAAPAPAELLDELANSDEATQLRAAENIAAASLKIKGKKHREFQDAMVPGLGTLVMMTQSDQDDRRTAAFDA